MSMDVFCIDRVVSIGQKEEPIKSMHTQIDEEIILDDIESRLYCWLESKGIFPDSPTTKKREYFDEKRRTAFERIENRSVRISKASICSKQSSLYDRVSYQYDNLNSPLNPNKLKYQIKTVDRSQLEWNNETPSKDKTQLSQFGTQSALKNRSSLLNRRGISMLCPIEFPNCSTIRNKVSSFVTAEKELGVLNTRFLEGSDDYVPHFDSEFNEYLINRFKEEPEQVSNKNEEAEANKLINKPFREKSKEDIFEIEPILYLKNSKTINNEEIEDMEVPQTPVFRPLRSRRSLMKRMNVY